ncbi:hypothetical protein ElyMa_002364800 [Elysia marginata]|uniref:ZP domain-containing protein n=1 Tax=Elysia marginata TaxID=1093978 RepID=A0AAV4GAL3_9GAST|nr:hypothetical protein ElyMa_002364800 [Elysia marginata]
MPIFDTVPILCFEYIGSWIMTPPTLANSNTLISQISSNVYMITIRQFTEYVFNCTYVRPGDVIHAECVIRSARLSRLEGFGRVWLLAGLM